MTAVRHQLVPHPLSGVTSVDELLSLPYFDILACLVGDSLHPGGGAATQVLLDACRLRSTDRVLEVGCGPGWTTRALLRAGVDVCVVDSSQRMIDAMLFYCQQEGLTAPTWTTSRIENLSWSGDEGGPIDLALLECVVGFVQDKPSMIRAIRKQLVRTGRIGVLDVHYTAPPPRTTLEALAKATGHSVVAMTKDDWTSLFSDMTCRSFQTFRLPVRTDDNAARIIAASGIDKRIPGLSIADLKKLEQYLDRIRDVFEDNKRYLAGHISVWEVGSTAH